MERQQAYSQLVASRKACTVCTGLVNPSACSSGKFDTNDLGPWTAWQGNLEAKILVVGQYWGDAKGFMEAAGLDNDYNPTCKNLMALLKSIGIEIAPPSDGQRSADRGSVAFTDAVLCLKDGGAQGDVSDEWFEKCGGRFLKPFIELVQPKVVGVTPEVRALG